MREQTHVYRWFSAATAMVCLTVLTVMLLPPVSAQQVDTDDEHRVSTYELRAGGPVPIGDPGLLPYAGSRWPVDPRFFFLSPILRAWERVADLDVTGAKREQRIDSMLDAFGRAGIPRDERQFYQRIAPAALLSWTGEYARPSPSPDVRGTATDSAGRVLPATAERSDGIKSWTDFIRNVIPVTQNPHGRAALFLATLQAQEQFSRASLQQAAASAPLPEFTGERQQAPLPPTPRGTGPRRNDNIIVRSSAQTGNDLANLQAAPYLLAANLPYPHNPAALTDPSEQLPSILSGPDQQRRVRSVAFGTENDATSAGGTGRVNQLLGIAPEGAPFAHAAIQRFVLDAALARAAAAAQGFLSSLGNVGNFLGGSAPNVGNLFPPQDLANRFDSRFGDGGLDGGGGAGGGGDLPPRLGDIPSEQRPVVEGCADRIPALAADDAKAVAVLLGLPLIAGDPWQVGYIRADTLYGIQGRNAETGAEETLGPSHFAPENSCVWAVLLSSQSHGAFVEDVQRPDGTKIHLQLR